MRFTKFFRFVRRYVFYPTCVASAAVYIDDRVNYNRNIRNLRAVTTGFRILWEYKINWNNEELNDDLHERVAKLILDTCKKNGGLYIKFGQGIASMNHILPKPYNRVFQVQINQKKKNKIKKLHQIF